MEGPDEFRLGLLMLTMMLLLACGPGIVFALGSWAVFRPGGPGLGSAAPVDDSDYEHGDLGSG